MKVGDTIRLSGGYDMEPKWLGGAEYVDGSIEKFIPGQNSSPAAQVRLSSPIQVDEVRGEILVLELRYKETLWTSGEVVHIELCDFIPEEKRWQDRKQGLWVESHATCIIQ